MPAKILLLCLKIYFSGEQLTKSEMDYLKAWELVCSDQELNYYYNLNGIFFENSGRDLLR